jgi:hypothetical protein
MGAKGFGFDRSFRMEMKQVLPNYELKRLPLDHSLYRSFYLMEGIGGRQKDPFWRHHHGQLTPVVYSQNDLRRLGTGPARKMGQRMRWGTLEIGCLQAGINYRLFLTSDYKKDLVHHPFIRGVELESAITLAPVLPMADPPDIARGLILVTLYFDS